MRLKLFLYRIQNTNLQPLCEVYFFSYILFATSRYRARFGVVSILFVFATQHFLKLAVVASVTESAGNFVSLFLRCLKSVTG